MKIKICLAVMLSTILVASSAHAFRAEGFSQPSGVTVDGRTNYIYVSNVVGDPKADDGNGFISRLKGDGTVDRMRFIDGAVKDVQLSAPKGMAVAGGRLYVADIGKLHAFDLESGRPLFDVNFGNLPVQHFYDVALGSDGALYVADGPANTIYRVDLEKQHEVTVFVSGEELGQPHSLTWYPGRQVFAVAGWSSGRVTAYDRAGKQQIYPAILLRTLEGIIADSAGNMFVSSSGLGAIYRIGANFALHTFKLGLKSPAGVAYSAAGNEVVIACPDTGMVESMSIGDDEEERAQAAVTESVQKAPPPTERPEGEEKPAEEEGKAPAAAEGKAPGEPAEAGAPEPGAKPEATTPPEAPAEPEAKPEDEGEAGPEGAAPEEQAEESDEGGSEGP